ncbi:MAG: leucyl/phenylalanyl-tRNA--protein transferase [Pseudomonadota bacterium]
MGGRRGFAGFPDPAQADADGLVAIGGDLAPERLIGAYANGIFPWFNDDRRDILWWSPDPRAVIRPVDFSPTRSLRKRLRSDTLSCTFDAAFERVIEHCALVPRQDQDGTWITPAMRAAYTELHRVGLAHSVEIWSTASADSAQPRLVGGLYGVSLGRMFFGESMFSLQRDASKCAFAALNAQLADWQFELIDAQMPTAHLASLGVREMPRARFLAAVRANDLGATRNHSWHFELGDLAAAGSIAAMRS